MKQSKNIMPQKEIANTSAAENNQRGQYRIARKLSTSQTIFTARSTPGLTHLEEIILRRAAQIILATHRIYKKNTTKGSKQAKKMLTEKLNSILADNADIINYFN